MAPPVPRTRLATPAPLDAVRTAPASASARQAPAPDAVERGRGRRSASSRATASCTSSCRRSIELEDYLELITAIEAHRRDASARRWSSKAICRRTTRGSSHVKVTPDPGVIEVNVHPADNWDELVEITTGVYEDARLIAPGHGKVRPRRHAHRHRRRQPRGARRPHAGRQPVPAPARLASQPRGASAV